MQNPDLFLSIGKEIKDEYGRVIGEVVSFAVKPQGEIEFVYVQQADGRFTRYPAGIIKVNGSAVVMLSSLKAETEVFCDRIPLIWRKSQALKELRDKNKISPELYDELQKSFEGALNQLKNEAKDLMARIDREIGRCSEEIRELNYALVHLEVEHEIGQIDEYSYTTALSRIQECLRRVNDEKSDLEVFRKRLSNILLGDFESAANEPEPAGMAEKKENLHETVGSADNNKADSRQPLVPIPPVVVYVNEAKESYL